MTTNGDARTMEKTHFARYSAVIRTTNGNVMDERLLMAQDGPLQVYYAPFEHVNRDAKVAIVGITPGKTQMKNALHEAKRQMLVGTTEGEILRLAKSTAGFSGPMRLNLTALLDRIGLGERLGLASSAELFSSARHRLHTCSVLPFPTFVSGDDYRGTPDPLKRPFLREQIRQHFEPVVKELRSAFFLPLGPVPTRVLLALAGEGLLDRDRVLNGMPHPSGANGERINYFLGKKSRECLSGKTDATALDRAREELVKRVGRIAK